MSADESIKTYRAVVELRNYSFEESVEELRHDGYTIISLTEKEEL